MVAIGRVPFGRILFRGAAIRRVAVRGAAIRRVIIRGGTMKGETVEGVAKGVATMGVIGGMFASISRRFP